MMYRINARRLRAEVMRQGLTASELVRRSGASRPCVDDALTGKRKVQITTLFRLAVALGLEPVDLIEGGTDNG